MGDYYDQLEAQLAALTARGAHRRRLSLAALVPRVRGGGVAVALTVAVVVVIAVVFLGAGKHSPSASSPRPVGGHGAVGGHGPGGTPGQHRPTLQVPPPQGAVVCQTDLRPPSGISNPSGVARIYEQGLGHFVLWAIASGIGPTGTGERYAVWLDNGPGKARRVGFAYHPGGASSELRAQLTLPNGAANYHTVVITRQPTNLSSNAPATQPRGQIVLEGSVSF
jgi:hypothetical protein